MFITLWIKEGAESFRPDERRRIAVKKSDIRRVIELDYDKRGCRVLFYNKRSTPLDVDMHYTSIMNDL